MYHSDPFHRECSTGSALGQRAATIVTILALLLTPSLSLANGAYTVLHDFAGPEGKYSYSRLLRGSDGAFYGTSSSGGTSNLGVVFRITSDGTYTRLHDFDGVRGGNPYSALIQDSDGSLVGTTYSGGAHDAGVVYRIAPSGAYSRLFTFSGPNGKQPYGGVIRGSDGALYGTAQSGGNYGHGVIYRIAADGRFKRLHDFRDTDGAEPTSALVEGSDGAYYGTAFHGGANNDGTLFRITADGHYTKLHDFGDKKAADGRLPASGLARGGDGALYGSTRLGGKSGFGIVFRVTLDGSYAKLHDFGTSEQGYVPDGVLAVDGDGALYGTTGAGGDLADGVVFKLTTDGQYSKLHDFYKASGHYAYAGVTLDLDGVLYGVASSGGSQDYGTIFKLDATNVPTATISATPATIRPGRTSTITWSSVGANGCIASSGPYFQGELPPAGSRRRSVSSDPQDAGGRFEYRLTCSGPGGSAKASTMVTVLQPVPTLELSANTFTAAVNTPIELTTVTTHAASCQRSGAWSGHITRHGRTISVTRKKAGTYPYVVSCSNLSGSVSKSVMLTFQ